MRRPALRVPSLGRAGTDLVIVSLILVLLALFAPLFGAILGLLVVWHDDRNGLTLGRNIAIACVALSLFDLVAPTVLVGQLVF